MPDYDLYSSEKGFVEDYRATLPGVEVFNFEELKKQLIYCLSHTDQYLNKFNGMRKELLRKYYNFDSGNSSEEFYKFINNFIK